ncbi:hypothetical protein RMN56_03185 [Micromonospora halotolerans]|uniref:Uncharacterized protein n=1 Tax=Micromonospora halotolerans TaxID=709879 RepID=A0ABY9ZYJ4_9ACTN|nr:hypothetical protein [Micromonospora halotolerans]WNM40376.1 hypothetical protein RMN56_03185 [Micromonospora halotolerans]
MPHLDVRRLAAVDMYGSVGSPVRRWVILAEFVVGVVGCVALGLWAAHGGGPVRTALGVYLALVGLNYVPLALHAVTLSRRGALARELAGVDVPAELRHYTPRQLWIFVPLLPLVLAVRQARGR